MRILSADYVLPISKDPISDGAIVIDRDKIIAVGAKDSLTEKFPEAEQANFGEAVIMPGLVNCHSHLEISILRGFLDQFDDDFASWLISLTKVRADKLTDEDIKNSANFGALEGVMAGVTCFADIGRFGEAGFEALRSSGLRGVLFQETDFSPGNITADEDFERLHEKYQTLKALESDLVKVGISPHAPYTVSPKLFDKIACFAVQDSVPLTIHVAESDEETMLMTKGEGFFSDIYRREEIDWRAPGTSSIRYLSDLGVLEAKPLLAHCVKVSEKDIDLIVSSDARIAHCPKSNAKFGHGIAPFDRFLRRNIKVGFGSDSVASNNTCDIFEEARFGALVGRIREGVNDFVKAKDVIETATIGGATAIGLENEIGTLDIGKQADIIVVSTQNAAQKPVYDVYSSLLFATNARDVVLTMVAGKELYGDGELKMVDAQEIKSKVNAIAKALL